MHILHDGEGRVPDTITTAVSIGAYDGIHRGHQAVLGTAIDRAKALGASPAVITFDVHPAVVLRPENAPKLLTTNEQRMDLFDSLGIEYVFLLHFDTERAQTDGRPFVEDVLVDRLRARAVVVGNDFHFAQGRSGDLDRLEQFGTELGFEVLGVDLLADAEASEPISSTAIRRALAGGDVAAAAHMLGRPFELRGPVVHGDQRGRTIGFPTANVVLHPDRARPADGVYAAWVHLADGSRQASAVNIGRRPTFHQHAEESLLEAHLLDFDGDIYGQELRIEFIDFLRSEQRFSGIDALVAQLKKDVDATRTILES